MYIDEKLREGYLALLKERLDEKRLKHTMGVEKMAVHLAEKYGEDPAKAAQAALLHDIAKRIKKKDKLALAEEYGLGISPAERRSPDLLHGRLAAQMMQRELGIDDADVLNAVSYHTTGRENMSRLEKIIYLADLIEEGRDYDGVKELRRLAERDLNKALLAGMNHVLAYLISEECFIDPMSVDAYNFLITEKEN